MQDGAIVKSDGNPLNAEAVIKVSGRYRDFALLETPTLGVLTRSSRVATNVYETLMAAQGKPVLFFPARFDMHEVQAADGYAYNIAIQRFNMDFHAIGSFVSTDAQATGGSSARDRGSPACFVYGRHSRGICIRTYPAGAHPLSARRFNKIRCLIHSC